MNVSGGLVLCDCCATRGATHPITSGEHKGEWACDECLCDSYVGPETGAEGHCGLAYGHEGEHEY